jgi:hypothetical protein
MILEVTLFPFLFPQGNGAYDGKISIHKYLKYRMQFFYYIHIVQTIFKHHV